MFRNLFIATLPSLFAVLCLGGLAHAQTGPSGPGTGTPTVTPTPTVQAGTLAEHDLEAALKALDPGLKISAANDGGKIYNLKVVRDGWTFLLQIESFQNAIWLNAELSSVIRAPQNIPANVMVELLKLNFKVGPTHFAFTPVTDNSGYKLFMCRQIGRQMNVEGFNASLNDLLKTVKDTYPTWSQVK